MSELGGISEAISSNYPPPILQIWKPRPRQELPEATRRVALMLQLLAPSITEMQAFPNPGPKAPDLCQGHDTVGTSVCSWHVQEPASLS